MWTYLYSSDLSPPDYDFFSKLKELLCRTCFGSLAELSLAMTREIRHLNEVLLNGIQKLSDRRHGVWNEEGSILKGCKFYFA